MNVKYKKFFFNTSTLYIEPEKQWKRFKEQLISYAQNFFKQYCQYPSSLVANKTTLETLALLYNNSFQVEKCENTSTKVIAAKRIGLKGENSYKNCLYRFISNLTLEHKFKNKEEAIKEAVGKKQLTEEEANKILGYKINF